MNDWTEDWQETLIDIAHEVGTYKITLTNCRDMPELITAMTKEFYFAYNADIEDGWANRDYISTFADHVHEFLSSHDLISGDPRTTAIGDYPRDAVQRSYLLGRHEMREQCAERMEFFAKQTERPDHAKSLLKLAEIIRRIPLEPDE